MPDGALNALTEAVERLPEFLPSEADESPREIVNAINRLTTSVRRGIATHTIATVLASGWPGEADVLYRKAQELAARHVS